MVLLNIIRKRYGEVVERAITTVRCCVRTASLLMGVTALWGPSLHDRSLR